LREEKKIPDWPKKALIRPEAGLTRKKQGPAFQGRALFF
jgi:hypothetical protein